MEILARAVVLHNGWEMDNEAWIEVGSDGIKTLKTTNHGGKYVMEITELERKISETESSLNQLKKLKRIMDANP